MRAKIGRNLKVDSAVQSIDVECNGKSVRENISALFIVVFYPRCTLPALHSVFTVCKAHHRKSPSSMDTQMWLVNPQKPILVKKILFFLFLILVLKLWLNHYGCALLGRFNKDISWRSLLQHYFCQFSQKLILFCKLSLKLVKVILFQPGFILDFQWIQRYKLINRL